jgi:oxygen-independent coproporphyrinogen III oxidase
VAEKQPTNLPQFTNLVASQQPSSLENAGELTAEGWIASASDSLGAYIHVPFCFHKCHYCDFFSVVGKESQHEAYVDRLSEELACIGPLMKPLQTIFIGGGTPTLLAPKLFQQMLEAIQKYLPFENELEYTIEANPETVTQEKAEILSACGVNRVSIGAQSFDAELLKVLERWHEPSSVARAVECVHNAGITNVNLDLIYAIPTQSIEQVQSDVRIATALKPTHMSCYALTYEPNTPLAHRLAVGEVVRVDHDLEADMFDFVTEELTSLGYKQYEISNYAKEGKQCKHNLLYWKNGNWWPFGPAGAGHSNGRRWRNTPRISDYLRMSPLPPVEDVELLSEDVQAGEAFMMGLRLLEGMERAWVDDLLSKSISDWRSPIIERNVEEGFLEWNKEMLLFTDKGLHFADTVISELLMRDENEPKAP